MAVSKLRLLVNMSSTRLVFDAEVPQSLELKILSAPSPLKLNSFTSSLCDFHISLLLYTY